MLSLLSTFSTYRCCHFSSKNLSLLLQFAHRAKLIYEFSLKALLSCVWVTSEGHFLKVRHWDSLLADNIKGWRKRHALFDLAQAEPSEIFTHDSEIMSKCKDQTSCISMPIYYCDLGNKHADTEIMGRLKTMDSNSMKLFKSE